MSKPRVTVGSGVVSKTKAGPQGFSLVASLVSLAEDDGRAVHKKDPWQIQNVILDRSGVLDDSAVLGSPVMQCLTQHEFSGALNARLYVGAFTVQLMRCMQQACLKVVSLEDPKAKAVHQGFSTVAPRRSF